MERQFESRVALVTGGGSGIGRASAKAFAREGALVVVADLTVPGGEETVRQIRAAGGEATFVQADVSRDADARSMVEKALQTYGQLDCAHNNAGILGTRSRTADCSEEDWDRTFSVNVKGTWLSMKYEIPAMLKQRRGAIVNTSSVAGVVGLRRFSAYSASKHAVLGLTKSAALEYFRLGIRVNAVCPGLIDTALIRNAVFGRKEPSNLVGRLAASTAHSIAKRYMGRRQPAGRMGMPDEVAEAVLWLCSDAAAYVNGHTLVVDGGLTAK